MESSSPPFVPDSPLFEPREPLSPEIELELRAACGIILRNLKPSGQIYEDIAKSEYNDAAARRRLQQARLEQRAPRPVTTKPPDSLPESYRPQPPLNRTVTSASSKSHRHVPTNASNGFANTVGSRQSSLHRRGDSYESARIPNFSQQLEGRVQRAINQDSQRPQTAGSDSTYVVSFLIAPCPKLTLPSAHSQIQQTRPPCLISIQLFDLLHPLNSHGPRSLQPRLDLRHDGHESSSTSDLQPPNPTAHHLLIPTILPAPRHIMEVLQ
jgi:hypothetical protein